MDQKNPQQYYVDIIAAMAERTIKRLFILCVALSVLLVGSWAGFLIYESQFETVTETTENYEAHVGGSGVAVNTMNGELNYGHER